MMTSTKSIAAVGTITITRNMVTSMKSTATVGTIITKVMMMTNTKSTAAVNITIITSTPNTATVQHRNPPVLST